MLGCSSVLCKVSGTLTLRVEGDKDPCFVLCLSLSRKMFYPDLFAVQSPGCAVLRQEAWGTDVFPLQPSYFVLLHPWILVKWNSMYLFIPRGSLLMTKARYILCSSSYYGIKAEQSSNVLDCPVWFLLHTGSSQGNTRQVTQVIPKCEGVKPGYAPSHLEFLCLYQFSKDPMINVLIAEVIGDT